MVRADVGNSWVGWEEDAFYEVRARVDDECDADPEFALLLRQGSRHPATRFLEFE